MKPLAEIAGVFTKLGLVAFGGPPAHAAMMEQEAVQRRAWLDSERFAEGLAVCQALPGPMSTQLAIWLGWMRGRWLGGIVAGLAFILPSFCILLILSYLYVRYGSIPALGWLFYGANPAVVAIVLAATWRLGKSSVKDAAGVVILFVAAGLTLAGFELVLTLLAAGLIGWILYGRPKQPVAAVSPLLGLALFFLKSGAFLYGGGYVILAFMEQQVVGQYGWLTRKEFLDGVALGQITPGPILIAAAFVGYKVAGVAGAAVSTAAIFLPSFVYILAAAPNLARIRDAAWFRAFIRGANPAVVGAILAAAVRLAVGQPPSVPGAIVDIATGLLFAISLVVLLRTKLAAPLVIAGAALTGVIVRRLGGIA